jgi:hypothetical protein
MCSPAAGRMAFLRRKVAAAHCRRTTGRVPQGAGRVKQERHREGDVALQVLLPHRDQWAMRLCHGRATKPSWSCSSGNSGRHSMARTITWWSTPGGIQAGSARPGRRVVQVGKGRQAEKPIKSTTSFFNGSPLSCGRAR